MESKRKVSSSLAAATIMVLLAVCFATSAFAACKRAQPPSPAPAPPSPEQPRGHVLTTDCGVPFSRNMAPAHNKFQPEEGCIGSSCTADDPCCNGCLCIPVLGKDNGICLGLCCIFPEPQIM